MEKYRLVKNTYMENFVVKTPHTLSEIQTKQIDKDFQEVWFCHTREFLKDEIKKYDTVPLHVEKSEDNKN